MKKDIEKLKRLATAIRVLSAQAVQKANSGHPGMPMGAADYSAVLWAYYLNVDPTQSDWLNRDRFVLSAGHGSMLLYSLLHLFEFDLPMEQLEQFRQWGSVTPGHPEFGVTHGVETTTGPLGQGFANGVGMALSQKMLGARYDETLFNGRVFGIVSDGDLMEGVAAEAASLAGHLKLDNLVYLYDDNQISIGGGTDVCFTEDVPKRFEAYGWHVLSVDGHDILAICETMDKALALKGAPVLICCKTSIGKGSPNKEGTCGVHGSPLGDDELSATLKSLGWNEGEFTVPADVASFCSERIAEKQKTRAEWDAAFEAWKKSNAELSTQLNLQLSGELPEALKADLLAAFAEGKTEASRVMSGKAIQVIAKHCPGFIGGSADLEPSTKTLIDGAADVQADAMHGRNLRFGVREHGMASIVNGIAYSRAWIPFGSTFLVFSDYLRPALRVAALSHIQSLQVFTHDSFWVGEDGPTHQPIEHVQSLRLIPNLYVFRPADGTETALSYLSALSLKRSPSALVFTRQNLPPLKREAGGDADGPLRGGYVVSGADITDQVVIATGSEVHVVQEAVEKHNLKVRVVSMPCVELFFDQDEAYQESVVPQSAAVAAVEAGSSSGWYRFTGRDGLIIGKDSYGASAPGGLLAEKFGFTAETVGAKLVEWCA